jgi:hypothetical protein
VRKKPPQKWLYKSQYLSGFVLYKKGEEKTIVFSAGAEVLPLVVKTLGLGL